MGMIGQRRVLGVLGCLTIAALAASCAEEVPGGAYDLSGRVSVELTEGGAPMPLGGALVTFTSDTGHVHETTTGSDGRYEMQVFSDTPFGQVRAEADTYVPSQRSVYFDNPERRIDLVLRPAPEM